MAFIRKISLGGNYGDSASTYVGDIDDIWTDDITKNILRRGDGTTPGGVIIGGAAGVSDYNSLTNKPTIPTDVSNLTDSTNLLTHTDITALQANVLTNTLGIATNVTAITVHDARLTTVETTAGTNTTAITAEEAARISGDAVVTAAQTVYTDTAIANLVDTAPGTLNTLNELADALGDDANFSTTVTNSIATNTAAITAESVRAQAEEVSIRTDVTVADAANLVAANAYTDAETTRATAAEVANATAIAALPSAALTTAAVTTTAAGNLGYNNVRTNLAPAIDVTVGYTRVSNPGPNTTHDHYVYLPDGTYIGQTIYLDIDYWPGIGGTYLRLLTDAIIAYSNNLNTGMAMNQGDGVLKFMWFGSDWKTFS